MTGQQRALDVGEHGGAEPDDAGEPVLSGAHPGEQVLPYLFFDAAVHVPGGTELSEGGCRGRVRAGSCAGGRPGLDR